MTPRCAGCWKRVDTVLAVGHAIGTGCQRSDWRQASTAILGLRLPTATSSFQLDQQKSMGYVEGVERSTADARRSRPKRHARRYRRVWLVRGSRLGDTRVPP